jgi:glycosyltransferase involved in cell wall biosynthesis
VRIWAPQSKALEAIVHSVLCVLYAGFVSRPDVLHIQAIGPALVTPLARLLGLKVVVTHHGPDYDRQKWGKFAKFALRVGERFGMRWSNERIVISTVISQIVQEKHGRNSILIPNGVTLPPLPEASDALLPFGLIPGRYVLLVSRLVPEKRHLDLIEAFSDAKLEGWKLAIVGASDHPDAYTKSVLERASQSPNVVCTGLQTGQALQQLYGHAGIFVLPSAHEGLPIALLEALSFGLPVIASDIPANLEVGLAFNSYFPLGNTTALSERIVDFAKLPIIDQDREVRREMVTQLYDWREISMRTLALYDHIS